MGREGSESQMVKFVNSSKRFLIGKTNDFRNALKLRAHISLLSGNTKDQSQPLHTLELISLGGPAKEAARILSLHLNSALVFRPKPLHPLLGHS